MGPNYARLAYEAYCKAFPQEFHLPWADLSLNEMTAWAQAAAAAVTQVKADMAAEARPGKTKKETVK